MTQTAEDCLTMAGARPIGLLIGDSQMMAARNALVSYAESGGTAVGSAAALACGAFFNVRIFNSYGPACALGRTNALAQLSRGTIKPTYAILFSQWHWYGIQHDNLGTMDSDEPAIDQTAAFVSGLRGTIDELHLLGIKRILIVGATPLFPRLAPTCLYRADRSGMDRAKECGVDRAIADAVVQPVSEQIAIALKGFPGVRYIDPFPDFCDATRCLPYARNSILFVDATHLSDDAVDWLVSRHKIDFDWVINGKQS